MKTRKNNKGFSLVELIVVVAIMAVLVGVLAPAYLKYVEKSRLQKDVSAIGEVVNAIEIALADENIATDTNLEDEINLTAGTATFTAAANAPLTSELAETIGSITLTSNALKATNVEISIGSDFSITVATNLASTATDAIEALGKLAEYDSTVTPD